MPAHDRAWGEQSNSGMGMQPQSPSESAMTWAAPAVSQARKVIDTCYDGARRCRTIGHLAHPTSKKPMKQPPGILIRQRLFGLAQLLAICCLCGCNPASSDGTSARYPDQKLKGPNKFNMGVVLSWRKGALPKDDKPNQISVGQTVVVRVRNLDGWLIGKLQDNRLTGEPDMTPEQRRNYNYAILEAEKRDEALDAFIKRYEDAALPRPAAPKPSSTPAGAAPATATVPAPLEAPSPSAAPALPPLPAGVTPAKLRDAANAYRALFDTVKRRLFLVINNSEFRNITAENPDAGVVNSEVKASLNDTVHEFEFRMRRIPGDEKAWDHLYDGTQAVHNVRVSIGVELDQRVFVLDTAVFPQADAVVQRTQLELFSERWLWGTLSALAVLLIGMLALGASTPLLRDTDLPLRADGCPQFSLSRLQLAFWTYLVVGAFLVIWLVTDRLDTLNTTILALLGISSGTTLASKLANTLTLQGGTTAIEPARVARRHKSTQTLRDELGKELKDLEAEALALEKKRRASTSAEADTQAAQLESRIQRLRDDLEYLGHSRITRFFIDLLAENGRVTLHRLQIIVWTAVLGIVFIAKVKRELSMPVFSETLLGLMGLSSLTYIALKIPELKKVEADVKASGAAEKADPKLAH